MTVHTRKIKLRKQLWRKIRYFGSGIKFADFEQMCDDPKCDCCLPKAWSS